MNEILDWMQGNWYALGSLVAQFAFLTVGLWFARKILKSLRATQQQFGALLKLSMTDELEDHSQAHEATRRPPANVVEDRPTPYVMAEWPTVKEAPLLSDELSGRAKTNSPMTATNDTTPYVAAPLTLPADEQSGGHIAAVGRGVIRWLQTPMANSGGPSPFRKVVRWLQAPARS